MQSLVGRMIGAAGFRSSSYEEVEADRSATGAAIGIVLLSNLAAAIGLGATSARDIVGLFALTIVLWVAWVLLTLFIGTRLLPESTTRSDFGEILRTTGFSTSVGILRIFGVLPVVGHAIFLAVTVWMLLTFVVAIRQALDYTSTARAFSVSLLGWVISIVYFVFVVSAG